MAVTTVLKHHKSFFKAWTQITASYKPARHMRIKPKGFNSKAIHCPQYTYGMLCEY